ncbi:MAG: helix-turn-helix domain-containing protein [Gemmataceae bacterium]|nr:helix-turn-helix domain-containing protein [Gemmataceae bacterium]
MKVEDIPVTEGSGNVFRDLGLPDADDLQLKAELVRQLCSRIKALRLTQVEAGKRLGLKQPDVSKLVHGRHTGFSADRLIALLNALQVDVEIVLRPQRKSRGKHGTVRVRQAV